MRQTILIAAMLAIVEPASAANTTCIGEPMSGRPYAHRVSGIDVDSGLGDSCFFAAESPIGKQIEKVCHIGDVGLDERGESCRIEAVVVGKVIRRIINIERVSPEKGQCSGILHRDHGGLHFGGGKGEDEGVCIISEGEQQKVLAICKVGQFSVLSMALLTNAKIRASATK
jgi:hypothetical protein